MVVLRPSADRAELAGRPRLDAALDDAVLDEDSTDRLGALHAEIGVVAFGPALVRAADEDDPPLAHTRGVETGREGSDLLAVLRVRRRGVEREPGAEALALLEVVGAEVDPDEPGVPLSEGGPADAVLGARHVRGELRIGGLAATA